jgi:hypothetical protein
MNFKVSLTILLLLTGQILIAQIVSFDEAEKVARNAFFERSYHENNIEYQDISVAKVQTEFIDQSPAVYVFNFDGGGFAIISGEAALPPLLGYSSTGEIPQKGFNENFDSFLHHFIDQVAYARQHSIDPDKEIGALWKKYSTHNFEFSPKKDKAVVVPPLISSQWNQDFPYNKLCPEDPEGPGGHVYAGCVATAMAMVMHYWRYPYQGTGTHGYSWDPYGFIYANFGEANYNYNHMQDVMDGNMPEVALLQFHCGIAVEMMYSPNGSGAYSWDVPYAIKNHFGYHSTASFKEKDNYSNTGWANLLKEQLDAGRPMYYSGFSSTGGHAFVCDGYDDANLFHFNFGWGGSANGFYTLQSVGGYNSGQGAVINFVPGGDYPYYFTGQQLITGKSGSIEDGSGPVENYPADADISWLISPQTSEDSISSITLSFRRFDLATDDYLFLYDGNTESNNLLGQFTGNTLPASVASTGNELLVVLKSNNSQTANGFLAEYATQSPLWCSGLTIISNNQGEVSDGSFQFNYANNKICKWLINPEVSEPATLYFTAFDTEAENDKVLIYNYDGMELLATYSGYYSPDNLPAPVTSASGKFFIIFATNATITGNGWEAYYAPDVIGTNKKVVENELMTYPNPADDLVSIKIPENISAPITISVYDLSGVLITEKTPTISENNRNIDLDVSSFKPGAYIIALRGETLFHRSEIIVYR